ncbi:MAG: DUF971 domain-containing protein [Luteolibacter sp.]
MKSIESVCVIGEELALSLSGGKEMYFPLAMLRRACPCAQCQGEPDAMGRVMRPLVEHGAGAFVLKRFEMVGGYGLQLFWADGHGTGIYSISYLEKLEGIERAG